MECTVKWEVKRIKAGERGCHNFVLNLYMFGSRVLYYLCIGSIS